MASMVVAVSWAALPGVVVAVAPAGEAREAVLLLPTRCARAVPPRPMSAGREAVPHRAPVLAPATAVSAGVAAHAEHFRVAPGFFFCVLVKDPGGLSVSHAAHRMAGARDGVGWGWSGLCALLAVAVVNTRAARAGCGRPGECLCAC